MNAGGDTLDVKGKENSKKICILICKKQDTFIIQMFLNANKKDIPTWHLNIFTMSSLVELHQHMVVYVCSTFFLVQAQSQTPNCHLRGQVMLEQIMN